MMSEHVDHRLDGQVAGWSPPTRHRAVPGPTSRWTGWIAFASVLMVMMGVFNAIEGLAGVLADDFYLVTPGTVLVFDLTTWGWIHLVVGGLAALAGVALLAHAAWARVVTVVLAVLNAVAQMAFAAVYPVWSVMVIGLCAVVIWALVAHGDEEP
jgi:hypothetical protein